MNSPIITPRCPGCDTAPGRLLGATTQAFCPNLQCNVFTWNPQKTPEDQMTDMQTIDLSRIFGS